MVKGGRWRGGRSWLGLLEMCRSVGQGYVRILTIMMVLARLTVFRYLFKCKHPLSREGETHTGG
jgi:hypothetical protein